ncbi:MAG TPA: 3-octaprenyl-4-hydroxybenzoate carboxy-lyase [Rhodocyclaceae bacterium]|nr:3-octaprenyl-4-hydroxybenzoate carboxy-lyase [Rhodocyclaceae bacterium]
MASEAKGRRFDSCRARHRLIVAVTGASGAILAERFLLRAREVAEIELHLILSPAALLTAQLELGKKRRDWTTLADTVYRHDDLAAPLASGSFPTAGMVIIPCSMKTLAAVAHGFSDNLITRAAEVTLKERRRLVLAVRETPLSLVHLRNMMLATEAGAVVMPPVPAFYAGVTTIEAAADQFACRVLDLLGWSHPNAVRWSGGTS